MFLIPYYILLTFAALTDHELYMQRCLELAGLGAGNVAPNPMVGAILVHDNRIIGEGYHEQYGKTHAEVNCINSVAEADKLLINQSTIYVSLEPCAHFGKTPPCADLIIQNKIPKVIIACRDAFAKVNGLGIQKLKDAGVAVTEGILEKEALKLNRRFFCFYKNKRPFIILKWAQTADGFIAKKNYESIPISNEFSNKLVHRMRAEEMAIMVGAHTAKNDQPLLTTRKWPGKNPVRIFIDKQLKIDPNSALFNNNAEVIVINEIESKQAGHIHYFKINSKEKMLPQLMHFLYEKNINSVLVEGGSILLQSFIDADLWDEAFVITNEQLQIGAGIAAVSLSHKKKKNSFYLSTDRIDHYTNTA